MLDELTLLKLILDASLHNWYMLNSSSETQVALTCRNTQMVAPLTFFCVAHPVSLLEFTSRHASAYYDADLQSAGCQTRWSRLWLWWGVPRGPKILPPRVSHQTSAKREGEGQCVVLLPLWEYFWYRAVENHHGICHLSFFRMLEPSLQSQPPNPWIFKVKCTSKYFMA